MYRFVTALSVLLLALPALGQFDSGSDGTDLELDCESLGLTNCPIMCTAADPCEAQINLGRAATGDWDTPIPPEFAGRGIYDPQQWAVVYKYTTIDIPPFVTVTFVNHRKGAPVVWLAMDDVAIEGRVELNGAIGSTDSNSPYAIPGPGGFSGGTVFLGSSAGFGPGGGSLGGGGGYGSPGDGTGGGVMYGTASIVPLIGGSGGGANLGGSARSGGGGGGAILIASSGDIFLDATGRISANGGNASASPGGSGSGGGIRLIANHVSGMGMLRALGGTNGLAGGVGRIRVEAPDPGNDIELDDNGMPPLSPGEPGPVFPGAPGAPPILRVASLTVTPMIEKSVPTDPLATVAT
ncbi:MAG: hypothetical protein IID34_17535, partial [Planctomycetes bacterium]|nr:hypothetical protein [Planctomycetota bacterium]